MFLPMMHIFVLKYFAYIFFKKALKAWSDGSKFKHTEHCAKMFFLKKILIVTS